MERRFRIKGVNVKISSEQTLSKEIVRDTKSLIKGRWQFQNIKKSMDFLRRWNSLQTQAQKKKIDFLEYSAALVDLRKFRANNFTTFDVATVREFAEPIEDDYGTKHRVNIELSTPIEEFRALSLVEAYRKLGFRSDFSNEVIRRFIIREKNSVGSPLPYETSKEFTVWLESIDLKNDEKTIAQMVEALRSVTTEFEPKFVTDVGLGYNSKLVEAFDMVVNDFERLAADPSTSPSGAILGQQSADIRLMKTLEELGDEAWHLAQTPDEKSGESFLHKLLHRNDATLCGPWDVEEESIEVKS